jgi:hypothetical protein
VGAVDGPEARVLGVPGVLGEQLRGELARGLALARAGGAVEEVGVSGRVPEGGAEDGLGVGVRFELDALILGVRQAVTASRPSARLSSREERLLVCGRCAAA